MSEPAQAVAVVADERELPTASVGKLEPNYYCRAWNPRRRKYCSARAGAGTTHPGVGRCRHHDGGGDLRVQHGQRRRYDLRSPRIQELLPHHEQDPEPLNILQELHLARAVLQDFLERYHETTAALLAWHRSWGADQGVTSPDRVEALGRLLDEYEEVCGGRAELTDNAREDLELVLALLEALRAPAQAKPRKVLDIAHVHTMIGDTTRIVERIVEIRAKQVITYAQLRAFLFAVDATLAELVPDAALRERLRERFGAIRV